MSAPRDARSRFVNYDPSVTPRFARVFRWAVTERLLGRRRRTPAHIALPSVEAVDLRAAPCAIWLGHATVLVHLGGHWLLTDPIFAPRLGPGRRRNVPVVLAPAALPALSAVVISHNHLDHLHGPSIRALEALAQPPRRYLVPLGVERHLVRWGIARERIQSLDWWQGPEPVGELDGLRVSCVPAQHWSQSTATDRNRTLWAGFVLEAGAQRVYFAGDSGYAPFFAEIGQRHADLDLALLPIGAYEPEWFMHPQHMNPEQALQCFVDLGARRMLGIHWGTYKLTDERLDEPPQRLEAARAALGLAPERVVCAPVGGRVELG